MSSLIHRFNDFAIDTEQKVLLRGGKAVPVAPKIFETLLALVENHGRIVLKEELMKRLWPDTFVEESNLTFNIQQLRKALGDNARKPIYVETIPRRGYRFIAGVEIPPVNQPDETAPAPSATDVLIAPQVVAPTRARVVAILTLIGVAIATIGLVYWTVARRGGESARVSKRIDDKAGKGLTLTGLTATGQSRQ